MNQERRFFLDELPLEDAWAVFRAALETAGLWQPLAAETIPLAEANGRITAAPVWARLSSPHYHASAMDGYAVRAEDTIGATEGAPLTFTVRQGKTAADDQPPDAGGRIAQPVNTGQPLPTWADAVIMIEHAQPVTMPGGHDRIEIRAAVPPWNHVRSMGEDMVATELVLPANHRLRPVDLGALAGSGHAVVSVYRRARVTIIPTGSELVPVESAEPGPGQIIEYNSLVLAAQVESWGGLPIRLPIVPDDVDQIRDRVREAAAGSDLILLNAGSSAGSEDYTAGVVETLGRLLVHGVAVRPGHPVVLGMVEAAAGDRPPAVPIIGVPGFPVSAALTGEIFVEPLLARWQGQSPHRPETLQGTLTRKVVSHTGDDDFVRVVTGKVGGRIVVTPISRGAGVITSLVRADGILRIPRFSEGEDAGAAVTVHLYRHSHEIERTIVAIGSHDLTLDLMAQFLAERHQGLRLASANVGSLGGLVALRRGEAHLAGSHLLDPETGGYNLSYIHRYLPGQEVAIVRLAGREQGWMVPRGNPKAIANWGDAARAGVTIVNRQRGAGTRVLLDYELARLGIDRTAVRGYDHEEYTHLAVAAAVASGAADTGLGIRAAASALKLDFVPLAVEAYELVFLREHYESDLVRPLLALLHEEAFRNAVAAMPGYDIGAMGTVRFVSSEGEVTS
ncbi:MAG TPA: molybdopterin biosynthesis protein [Promineifilum sp.]